MINHSQWSRYSSIALLFFILISLSGCSDTNSSTSFQADPSPEQTEILAKEEAPETPDESDFEIPGANIRAQASTVQYGDIILVSSDSSGQAANGFSYHPSLSSDGTYAVFASRATNLDGNPSGSYYQVFRKNLETGAVELVSRDNGQNGTPAFYPSYRPKVNQTGDKVAFTSYENLTGSSYGYQVYLRDLNTHTNQLISHTPSGGNGNSSSFINSFQGGGAISFYSYANNLVASDTNGRYDTFVWHPNTDSIEMMSVASDESQSVDHSIDSSVSLSGDLGIFRCYDNNLEGSGHPDPTLYLRDLDAGLSMALPGQAGPAYSVAASTGGYWVSYAARVNLNGSYTYALYRKNMSSSTNALVHDNVYPYDSSSLDAQGKFIAYTSADQGGPDSDGQYDIYIYDRVNNRHRAISLQSPGSGSCYRPFISQDGSTICWDQNGQVYAAPNPYWGYQPPTGPEVISRGGFNVPGNGNSLRPSLSYTGRYVAFDSRATNLIYGAGSPYISQVYRKDLEATSSAYSWVSEPLGSYMDEANRVKLSREGSRAFFSANYDLIQPSGPGLFAIFREIGTSLVNSVGGSSSFASRYAWSIGGERYCCFNTSESLVAGDTMGEDVYLEDQQTSQLTLVSVDNTGQRVNGSNYGGWVSHDGTKVAWVNFNGSINNIWVRDLSTGDSGPVVSFVDNTLSDLANWSAAVDLSGNGEYLAWSKNGVVNRLHIPTNTYETFNSAQSSKDTLEISDDGRYIVYIEQSPPWGVVKVLDAQTSSIQAVSNSDSEFFDTTPKVSISGNGASVSWHSKTMEDNGAYIQIWIAANPLF